MAVGIPNEPAIQYSMTGSTSHTHHGDVLTLNHTFDILEALKTRDCFKELSLLYMGLDGANIVCLENQQCFSNRHFSCQIPGELNKAFRAGSGINVQLSSCCTMQLSILTTVSGNLGFAIYV
jgi:hypothetical protein